MVYLNSAHSALNECLPKLKQGESTGRQLKSNFTGKGFDVYVEGIWQPDPDFENFMCSVWITDRHIKGPLFKDRRGRPFINAVVQGVLYKIILNA
jgi:hypothetical protein